RTDIVYAWNDPNNGCTYVGGCRHFDVFVPQGVSPVLQPAGTGISFYKAFSQTFNEPWYDGTSWRGRATFLTGDFNGDGASDIAYVTGDIEVYLSQADPSSGNFIQLYTTAAAIWGSATLPAYNWKDYATFLTGDFNGDGKTDIMY